MSASVYSARHNCTLLFCPPDKLTPLSPISVCMPSCSMLMSCSSLVKWSKLLIFSSDNACSIMMLLMRGSWMIQGSCEHYATFLFFGILITPFEVYISFKSASRRVVLPLPTGPEIMCSLLAAKVRLILSNMLVTSVNLNLAD